MTNKGIIITEPIYRKAIIVFRGDDIKKAIKFYKSCYISNEVWEAEKDYITEGVDNKYKGVCLRLEGGDILIHLREDAGTSTISHEAFHAVEFIFETVGVNFGPTPNEAYAYFLAFIVGEIVDKLYKE